MIALYFIYETSIMLVVEWGDKSWIAKIGLALFLVELSDMHYSLQLLFNINSL